MTPEPTIEALALRSTARAAAYQLRARHPEIVFTSGRRTLAEQARAMAGNVTLNRRWIAQTYRDSVAVRALQAWITVNPVAASAEMIANGLLSVLQSLDPRDANGLSKHLSGDAFDVQPIAGPAGEAVKTTIRELRGLQRFLDHEGGLTRWHAQFVEGW